MMAFTPSELTKRSAAAVAAAASMQVLSARTVVMVVPPKKAPLSLASFKANSAPDAMGGAKDSAGPVKPKAIPILIFSACADVIKAAAKAVAVRIFFISNPLQVSKCGMVILRQLIISRKAQQAFSNSVLFNA
jgi:hypothetical protein